MKVNFYIFRLLVGPSWLMLLWTRHEIMAISLVLCLLDLVVLRLKDKDVIGGDCLFMSSMVTATFLGSAIRHSYLHQVALKLAKFFTY